MSGRRVVLGVTGASGAALAMTIARGLADMNVDTDLVISQAAERTLELECGPSASEHLRSAVSQTHANDNPGASIASGSVPVAGMIVAPCSMRSLAAVAHGFDDTLIARAAGVQLKERRPLVLITREAPLALTHLKNMVAATEAGAIILPPVPAFYLAPRSVDDITQQIAARAIDLLRIGSPTALTWKEPEHPGFG